MVGARTERACHNLPARLVSHSKASEEPGAMRNSELVRFEVAGAEMAIRLAGDREKPALLLIREFIRGALEE